MLNVILRAKLIITCRVDDDEWVLNEGEKDKKTNKVKIKKSISILMFKKIIKM